MLKLKKYTINKKNAIGLLLIIITIFLIGMFLLSNYTSPLYVYDYGYDSAIFSLIGKGIVNGKIVYKDLFDHKGPLLFFIEALGYYLGGHTGILLIQCLFGLVNLIFIYAIWKKIRTEQKNLLVVDLVFILIAVFSTFFYTFEGGNLSEEYSLPFISGCLYLFTRYAINTKNEVKHPYIYSFIYGASLMSLALIRINNAITIFAGILSIMIYLIYKKEYKNLFLNLLFGLLGCITVSLPFIIYFGMHKALYDMIYATFIYNFEYAESIGHSLILSNLKKYLLLYMPMILSIILILTKNINNKKYSKSSFFDFMLMIIVLCNTICLIIANSYPHYFTVYMPVFMIILTKYWTFNLKSLKTIMITLCIFLYLYNIAYIFKTTVYSNYINDSTLEKHTTIKNDLELIPVAERNSVIGYGIPAAYYLHGDIIPCYKYYTHQEWWSISNPSIQTEFIKWLQDEKPLWLLTVPDEDNQELCNIILNNYELKHSNNYLNIYRLQN